MLQFSLTNTVSCAEMSISVFHILWKFLIFFRKVSIILLIDMLPQEVFPSLQYFRIS